MLTAIAIIPSAPVLVPQMAGEAAVELAQLRRAVFEAAGALPAGWLAFGVGAQDQVVASSSAGTFGGYGVDVRVGLSSTADLESPGELPLCALITGWVREQVSPEAEAEVWVFAGDQSAEVAARRGLGVRAMADASAEPVGVLAVVDGAHTLTPTAPGGHDPASAAVQAALDDALAAGDVAGVAMTPPSIPGHVGWQVLAGLAGEGPRSAEQLYRGAPYGVGYFAGLWHFG